MAGVEAIRAYARKTNLSSCWCCPTNPKSFFFFADARQGSTGPESSVSWVASVALVERVPDGWGHSGVALALQWGKRCNAPLNALIIIKDIAQEAVQAPSDLLSRQAHPLPVRPRALRTLLPGFISRQRDRDTKYSFYFMLCCIWRNKNWLGRLETGRYLSFYLLRRNVRGVRPSTSRLTQLALCAPDELHGVFIGPALVLAECLDAR